MATRQILLDTEMLVVGRFRCPPGDARWTRENWIGPEHHVVFPARTVVIDQAGVGRVVANPNHAVMSDADSTSRRELVSPDGDVSTYVALRAPVVREVLGVDDNRPARFAQPEVWLQPGALLRLQLLIRAVERGPSDAFAAEVGILELVGEVLRGAGEVPASATASRDSTRIAHRDLVHDTQALLSARFTENLRLADVARSVGASPYHLARVFRARTGQSLHGYREQVRLRIALERLLRSSRRANLAALAEELGFASHSHLDARFRRTFGRTPGEVRAIANGADASRLAVQMRTIVQGPVPVPA